MPWRWGLACSAVTFAAEKVSGRIPGALVGLVIAALAVVLFHLQDKGVAVLGATTLQLPHLGLPAIDKTDLIHLVALALIVSIVVMVQTAATTRAFVTAPDGVADVNRDFIGVGAGSVIAGLTGAFPVNASPPRTAVASESGGRSSRPLPAWAAAAALVGLLAMFGAALLAALPAAALAGVLLFVAQRITRLPLMAQIYRQSWGELALVVATLLAIVFLPIQIGVAAGVCLSVLHGVWTTTQTRTIEFERLPGTSIWWPPINPAKGEKIPGVMVLAFQAPAVFLFSMRMASAPVSGMRCAMRRRRCG